MERLDLGDVKTLVKKKPILICDRTRGEESVVIDSYTNIIVNDRALARDIMDIISVGVILSENVNNVKFKLYDVLRKYPGFLNPLAIEYVKERILEGNGLLKVNIHKDSLLEAISLTKEAVTFKSLTTMYEAVLVAVTLIVKTTIK